MRTIAKEILTHQARSRSRSPSRFILVSQSQFRLSFGYGNDGEANKPPPAASSIYPDPIPCFFPSLLLSPLLTASFIFITCESEKKTFIPFVLVAWELHCIFFFTLFYVFFWNFLRLRARFCLKFSFPSLFAIFSSFLTHGGTHSQHISSLLLTAASSSFPFHLLLRFQLLFCYP